MTAHERRIQLGHLRLAALEWGPEDAPAVLALHGWLDNAASFARLAPLLGDLHLIALDLPGHGRSEHRPHGCLYHFVDWVPAVLEAADVIGWPRYAVIGHSMGAGISALLPAVAPDRVDRVVLLEGAGPMTDRPEDAPRRLAEAIASESGVTEVNNRVFQDLEAAVSARLRDSDLDRDSARLLVERASEPCGEGVRFTHDPRLKTRSRMRLTEDQVMAFLRGIRCPVLAVRASGGWNYPEDVVAARLAVISELRAVEVDGGHHVHLTNPERVAPLIRDFLGA
jgi:pimeloyl-ACP methyl ester carboxylesterase